MTKITPKTKASEQNKSSSKSTPPAAAHRATNQSRRPSSTASAPDSPVLVNVRKSTKRDQLVALLVRDEGATLDQMIAATGWLPHTTRAALTGPRQAGYAIESGKKVDGARTYRAVAPK